MIESIQIVGARGRVGSTVSARLAERGIALDSPSAELVLLCVPDRAIAEVAAEHLRRAVGRSRQRRDTARCARPAHAPLLACTRCSRSRRSAGRSSSTASGVR